MPVLDMNNPDEVKEYETFISTSPYGHMLQSLRWAQVKNNWDPHYVYLRNNAGNISAAMSVLAIKNDGEHAFLYAPRGPVCDIYDTDTVRELISLMGGGENSYVAKQQAFVLRMDPDVIYDQQLIDTYASINGMNVRSRDIGDEHAFSNPRNHMILPFHGRSIDDIIATYPKKFRYQIRRTYKDGLHTRMFTVKDALFSQALDRFYDLTQQMAQRKGISYRPHNYFVRLCHAFDDVRLYETYDDDDEVLSSGIVVHYNKKAFYIYAATSDNKRHLQPSVQMIIEAMRHAVDAGMDHFDFGGVYTFDASDGLYLYKSKYCGPDGRQEYIGELDMVYNTQLYQDFIN
ncbi:MAG: peptidoglycan bridge formation glycyltransferase FemA/FemB family protein [Actinomycetaceae bacterium]|nr:peptidoglycan bridge formation glycyltransferase FemA/FemB family protein [Actinomycetaceae bacterium]